MKSKIRHFFVAIIYAFLWVLAFLVFHVIYPYRAVGNKKMKGRYGVILCSNHISMLDVFFIILTAKHRVNFMAKEELFKNKALAALLRGGDAFPVSRATGDRSAIERAENVIKWGRVLGIFVEGTRTKDPNGRPGRAKSGAAYIASQTGADVIPVAVIYKKGRPKLFRRVTVRYGDVIPNEELHIDENNRAQLRAATERIMGSITALWEEGI